MASYACYAIGYSYACQATATGECIASYACYTTVIRNYTIFTPYYKCLACRFYYAVARAVIHCIPLFYGYTCQTATTGECTTFYICYAGWYGYTRQTTTTGECTISYACYTIGYGYVCQAATIGERITSYARYGTYYSSVNYLLWNVYLPTK